MSDELRTPCRESETPDDWFIGRDGKQYSDEDLVGEDRRDEVLGLAVNEADEKGLEGEERERFLARAIEREEAEARKGPLARRRHAKEECFTSCLFRMNCLDVALKTNARHGTWGGYYEEELEQIRKELSRRNKARLGRTTN